MCSITQRDHLSEQRIARHLTIVPIMAGSPPIEIPERQAMHGGTHATYSTPTGSQGAWPEYFAAQSLASNNASAAHKSQHALDGFAALQGHNPHTAPALDLTKLHSRLRNVEVSRAADEFALLCT